MASAIQSVFREAIAARWPWIVLLYVLAGCTGKVQKADVDGANVIKAYLRVETNKYIAERVAAQLGDNIPPNEVRIDLSLTTLKPRMLGWLWDAFEKYAAAKEARLKGWARCGYPRAFDPATRAKAVALHADGKLWPSTMAEDAPTGEEPGPDDDRAHDMADIDDAEATGGFDVALDGATEAGPPCVPLVAPTTQPSTAPATVSSEIPLEDLVNAAQHASRGGRGGAGRSGRDGAGRGRGRGCPAPLLQNWSEHVTPEGREYWANELYTWKTRWTRPRAPAPPPPPPPPNGGRGGGGGGGDSDGHVGGRPRCGGGIQACGGCG